MGSSLDFCALHPATVRRIGIEESGVLKTNVPWCRRSVFSGTAAPSTHDARHLSWLRDQVGERFAAGVVLHTGPASFPLGERLWALPISSLWS